MRGRPTASGVAGAVIAFVVGAVVGTLGAFKHQAGVSALTGEGFPSGLVLSLVMIAVVLAAFRIASPTRWRALAAGLGVVAAVGVFSLRGPGGSQVVVGDVEGVIWMIAPVLIAAAAVLVPGRRPAVPPDADGILAAEGREDPAP